MTQEQHPKSRSWILVAVLIVGLMLGGMVIGLRYGIERADRLKCASNLRAIGQSILRYSQEYQGYLPPDQGTLCWTEEISAQVFICPSTNTAMSTAAIPREQYMKMVNAGSDYVYLGAGVNVNDHQNDADQVVMMCDKEQNHHGDGMSLVFLDGHTDWKTLDAARKAIAISKEKTATTQRASSQPAGKSP